jgi:hypothetical protein
MKPPRKLEDVAAAALSVPERMLLFCIASDMDWQKAGITGATITAMVVKGLIDQDAAGRLTLAEHGRAALASLLNSGCHGPARFAGPNFWRPPWLAGNKNDNLAM